MTFSSNMVVVDFCSPQKSSTDDDALCMQRCASVTSASEYASSPRYSSSSSCRSTTFDDEIEVCEYLVDPDLSSNPCWDAQECGDVDEETEQLECVSTAAEIRKAKKSVTANVGLRSSCTLDLSGMQKSRLWQRRASADAAMTGDH
mmetsp:Transcript_124712/g.233200  ORF Transcript_124712/g.233200 Transcript_124712/m.233200 type:complete len:146 (-) Transcript_124712:268-705(-)